MDAIAIATTSNIENKTRLLDGTTQPTQHISWNSKHITNLADLVNAQDVATKNYVDSATFDKVYTKAKVNSDNITHASLNVGTASHVDWNVFSYITGDTGNFDSNTGIFTAPNTGIYALSKCLQGCRESLPQTL